MRDVLIQNMRRIGLDAYEVGGCIRDELIGKQPKDVDFAVCGVTYDELSSALAREGSVTPNVVGGRLVGCRLRASWTDRDGIEVSLARTERSTETGRAHFEVNTDPSLGIVDDLSRRDFTINAIARSVRTGEFVDPFGGAADVRTRTLRVISEASFAEDPSRILRGLVRVAKDGFRPDEQTLEQMRRWAPELAVEPAEQVFLEFDRLLAGGRAAEALRIAASVGVLQVALPELAPIVGFKQESRYHDLTCDEHTFRVVEEACLADADQVVRWAALFHDSGKPGVAWRGVDGHLHFYANPDDPHGISHQQHGAWLTRAAFNRLKQPPNEFREAVIKLVEEHMFTDDRKVTPLRARRFIQRVGRDSVRQLLLLRRCDRAGKRDSPLPAEQDLELRAWERVVEEQMHQPLHIAQLAVNGHDALQRGFAGRAIGVLLNDLLRIVTDDPSLNQRERLLSMMDKRVERKEKT